MPSWVCQWKPCWIPVGKHSKKAFLDEWIFADGDSSDIQNVTDFSVLHSIDHTDYIRDDHPPTPRPSRQPDSLPCEPTRPQDKAHFGNELRHHCLLDGHDPDATSFIHDSSVLFLNAWNCHFQKMKCCAATKIFSLQVQINLLRGSR